jgi:hypothetical protein
MIIYIRSLTGRKIEYNIEQYSTVFQLKENIQEKEGIDLSQIRLILGGKQLNDHENFTNMLPGSTIHCILQLRGG